MEFTAQQIADYLQGTIVGDASKKVFNFSKIEEGKPGTLTFLSNPKYTHYIYSTLADVVLVNDSFVPEQPVSVTLVKVKDAYAALAKLLTLVDSLKAKSQGIDTTASIAQDAVIEDGVYIGAFAVIGRGVKIASGVRIYPHVVIGDGVTIGKDTMLYPHVTLYDNIQVGERCIIHAGAVIGADGFGFAPDEQGVYHKIPQIGNVRIGNDVEIGANTTIDRATMESTMIHDGVKIDNLVQVAHNVEIGQHTALAAQVGIAGSTKIGQHCVFAGQVGVAGHLNIAERSIFGAQTGVASSVKEAGKIWQGSPNVPVNTFRRVSVAQKQIVELMAQFNQLQKEVKLLKEQVNI